MAGKPKPTKPASQGDVTPGLPPPVVRPDGTYDPATRRYMGRHS